MPEHPLDFGLILGSTCTSIWSEETNRHDGLIALRRMFEHLEAGDTDAARRRLQKTFSRAGKPDITRLQEVALALSLHAQTDPAVLLAAHPWAAAPRVVRSPYVTLLEGLRP